MTGIVLSANLRKSECPLSKFHGPWRGRERSEPQQPAGRVYKYKHWTQFLVRWLVNPLLSRFLSAPKERDVRGMRVRKESSSSGQDGFRKSAETARSAHSRTSELVLVSRPKLFHCFARLGVASEPDGALREAPRQNRLDKEARRTSARRTASRASRPRESKKQRLARKGTEWAPDRGQSRP